MHILYHQSPAILSLVSLSGAVFNDVLPKNMVKAFYSNKMSNKELLLSLFFISRI